MDGKKCVWMEATSGVGRGVDRDISLAIFILLEPEQEGEKCSTVNHELVSRGGTGCVMEVGMETHTQLKETKMVSIAEEAASSYVSR